MTTTAVERQREALTNGPRVVLIALRHDMASDRIFKPAFEQLKAKANIQQITDSSVLEAALLDQPRPVAVIVTDPALTLDEFDPEYQHLMTYVNEGGTSIAMSHFHREGRCPEIDSFFAKCGLYWEDSDLLTAKIVLNREAVKDDALAAKLLPSYEPRMSYLRNVTLSHAWYVKEEEPVDDSDTSNHFVAERRATTVRAAIAYAGVGEGRFGYVGDRNMEEGSVIALLAMCGL